MTSAAVSRDNEGKPRGFGFINFATAEAASNCVSTLNGREVKGKTLWAGRAQKKAERAALLKQRCVLLAVSMWHPFARSTARRSAVCTCCGAVSSAG